MTPALKIAEATPNAVWLESDEPENERFGTAEYFWFSPDLLKLAVFHLGIDPEKF